MAHGQRADSDRVGEALMERNRTYHLLSNSCQTYALMLWDAIKDGGTSDTFRQPAMARDSYAWANAIL
jgi:hypothetical protein